LKSRFHLLNDMQGVARLLAVNTIQTGSGGPGLIRVLTEDRKQSEAIGLTHLLGPFDVLRAAWKLAMTVPADVVIIAVEGADCTTRGRPDAFGCGDRDPPDCGTGGLQLLPAEAHHA
jgi:hypothetical protein